MLGFMCLKIHVFGVSHMQERVSSDAKEKVLVDH